MALRIVEEDGIDGLRYEVSRRKCQVNIGARMKDLDKAITAIKRNTMITYNVMAVAALYDCFQMSPEECIRWMHKFEEGTDLLTDDLTTWEDLTKGIAARLGIKIEVEFEPIN